MTADSTFYFLLGLFFLALTLYILWAILVIERPFSPYNKFKINVARRYLSVDGEIVNFSEIESITVNEMAQPGLFESQCFHRAGFLTYFTTVVFHLKDKTNVTCIFNTKASLYNTLKKLSPFVTIHADIKQYRTYLHWIWFSFPLAYILFLLIYFA